jgi:hypothetical protein
MRTIGPCTPQFSLQYDSNWGNIYWHIQAGERMIGHRLLACDWSIHFPRIFSLLRPASRAFYWKKLDYTGIVHIRTRTYKYSHPLLPILYSFCTDKNVCGQMLAYLEVTVEPLVETYKNAT